MMKKITLALASLATVGSVLAAVPAVANTASVGCEENGHPFSNVYTYTQDTNNHYWDKVEYKLGGSGTGDESNVRFWLTINNDTTRFDWSSADDRVNGTWYTKQIDVTSQRDNDEKFRGQAVFDTFGTDNRCTALLDY